MLGSKALVGLSMTMLLVLVMACGGQTTWDPSSPTTGTTATNGGAGNAAAECLGGAPDGGCGGEGDGDAGERALDPYARLRTACSLSARVNRRGAPVSIDYCIR